MENEEALKGADIEQETEQERVEIDPQRFLKWQKDANRQLKEFREFLNKSRSEASNQGTNQETQSQERKSADTHDSSGRGLTQDDLIHFATYSRLVGKLSDDEASDFDNMNVPYKERITALNFYLKGKGKSVVKTEAPEEPQPRKTKPSNPETPKGQAGVPSFRSLKEYMNAKPEDRKLWRSAGNSPSALPEK